MKVDKECEIVQDLLLGYADGVLNETSKALVEEHLVKCEVCQKAYAEIKKDIQEEQESQTKQIDYLKKVKAKNRIKSVFTAILIIIFMALVIYIRKWMIINHFLNTAEMTLQTNNFYRLSSHIMSNDKVSVVQKYYKDGKYKEVTSIYTDDVITSQWTQYATQDMDERIQIQKDQNKVMIQKGEWVKIMNQEKNLKNVPYVADRNFWVRLGMAFGLSITTDTYSVGKPYYVLRDIFEPNQRWEIWIDKQTGLPLKEINKEGIKNMIPNTEIVKSILDNTTTYQYDFGVVKDEDVQIPDIAGYEVEYVDM